MTTLRAARPPSLIVLTLVAVLLLGGVCAKCKGWGPGGYRQWESVTATG